MLIECVIGKGKKQFYKKKLQLYKKKKNEKQICHKQILNQVYQHSVNKFKNRQCSKRELPLLIILDKMFLFNFFSNVKSNHKIFQITAHLRTSFIASYMRYFKMFADYCCFYLFLFFFVKRSFHFQNRRYFLYIKSYASHTKVFCKKSNIKILKEHEKASRQNCHRISIISKKRLFIKVVYNAK